MRSGLKRPLFKILFLVWLTLVPGAGLNAPAIAETKNGVSPKSLLLIPFTITSSDQSVELVSFVDHANKTLKEATEGLGADYSIQTARELNTEGGAGPSISMESQAIELAAQKGFDLAIFGFVGREETQYRFRGYMWARSADRSVVTTDIRVENIHALPGILQTFLGAVARRLQGTAKLPFYRGENQTAGSFQSHGRASTLVSVPKNSGPWRSPEMPLAISSIDIGDLDGDGKNETVFVDEAGITISRFETGGLRALTRYAQLPAFYISAEIQDLDGDGVAELILCYQLPHGLESSILTYRNMNLSVLKRFPNVLLKTALEPTVDSKPILLGQRTDVEDMFSGAMIRYSLENGVPEEAGTVKLPAGTFILSYASGHVGESQDFMRLILSQDQRLMAFDEENRLLGVKQDRMYGVGKRLRLSTKSGAKNVIFPGRILISKAGGSSFNELLLIKQVDSGSLVEALSWDGAKFVDKWKTVTSPGIISDFLIRDFKNEGENSLVLILVNPLLFPNLSGFKSVVYAYDMLP